MPEELGRKRKKKSSAQPTSSTESLSAAFAEIGAVEKVQKLGEVFGGARERRLLKHEVLKLKRGAKVKVFWPGQKRWYPATIIDVNEEDGTFAVYYDDDRALPTHTCTQSARQSVRKRSGFGCVVVGFGLGSPCLLAERQADSLYGKGRKSKASPLDLAKYRRDQAKQNPELWTEVPASEIKAFVPAEPLIDAEALVAEFTQLQPALVTAARALGAGCSARAFVRHLLNAGKVSQASYPQTRLLLQMMLVLPASSVQSERDFSLQVRADSLAIGRSQRFSDPTPVHRTASRIRAAPAPARRTSTS